MVSVTGVSAEYNWCRAGGLLGSSAYLTHNCYASGNVSLQDSAESVKNVYLGCLIGEQSGGVVVSGHYFNGAVLRCNGETQTVKRPAPSPPRGILTTTRSPRTTASRMRPLPRP